MNNPIELKPCPFCNGKAKLVTYVTISNGAKCAAYCKCEKCEARTAPCADLRGDGRFIFEAIDDWNGRAEK